MNVDIYVAAGGIIINLLALLIAVGRILSTSSQQYTTSEVRNAERFARLETKTSRVESDIQALFDLTRKNAA